MYKHEGKFYKIDDNNNRIRYDIDTSPGNSGGPVYRI